MTVWSLAVKGDQLSIIRPFPGNADPQLGSNETRAELGLGVPTGNYSGRLARAQVAKLSGQGYWSDVRAEVRLAGGRTVDQFDLR